MSDHSCGIGSKLTNYPTAYIYVITNTINGKQYVGQTCRTPKARWRQHVTEAFCESPMCPVLAGAIREHGEAAFTVDEIPLRLQFQSQLDAIEIALVSGLGTQVPNGYNLAGGGTGGRLHHESIAKVRHKLVGRKFSDESRAKMSVSQRKRFESHPPTAETRAKQSAAHTGKRLSEAHKAKLSEINKGRPSPLKGTKLPPEWCANVSKGLKGRKGTNLGRKFSSEWRMKISASLKGRVGGMTGKRHSPETKAKITESNRRRLAHKAKRPNESMLDP